jgi:hypothetical protein
LARIQYKALLPTGNKEYEMKYCGIFVGTTRPQGSAIEYVIKGEPAERTPQEKLFVDLVAEDTWSRGYDIYVSTSDEQLTMVINHPAFLPDRPLVIREKDSMMSVRDVEDAVRKHFHNSVESMEPEIKHLQDQRRSLSRASSRILEDKAAAAITAAFPETTTVGLKSIGVQDDLYCFTGPDPGIKPVFAARVISNDFVGGVARINISGGAWYEAEVGVKKGQRLGIFWEALARAFAKEGLHYPEEFLERGEVDAEEKEFLWPRPVGYDPYIVREVRFRPRFTDEVVIVTFGANNLPVDAVLTKAEVEV